MQFDFDNMREVSFSSKKSTEEMLDLVASMIMTYDGKVGNKRPFEGKLKGNEFTFLPLFDFGPREQLRPIIYGKIVDPGTVRVVELKFGLPPITKWLVVGTIVVHSALTLVLGITPLLKDFPLKEFWWAIPVFLLVTMVMFYKYWNFKVQKSLRIIRRALT